jgi:hypothetical protein
MVCCVLIAAAVSSVLSAAVGFLALRRHGDNFERLRVPSPPYVPDRELRKSHD